MQPSGNAPRISSVPGARCRVTHRVPVRDRMPSPDTVLEFLIVSCSPLSTGIRNRVTSCSVVKPGASPCPGGGVCARHIADILRSRSEFVVSLSVMTWTLMKVRSLIRASPGYHVGASVGMATHSLSHCPVLLVRGRARHDFTTSIPATCMIDRDVPSHG